MFVSTVSHTSTSFLTPTIQMECNRDFPGLFAQGTFGKPPLEGTVFHNHDLFLFVCFSRQALTFFKKKMPSAYGKFPVFFCWHHEVDAFSHEFIYLFTPTT